MVNMSDQAVIHTLVSTSQYTALAGAALLLGMSIAAFTKAGKGKNAGAKTGFAITGVALMSGVGLLVYVAVQIMMTNSSDKQE